MSTECLTFLEFVDEAEILLKQYSGKIKSNPQEFQIISFHPSVKAYLLEHDIKSTDSFRFCPTKSHQSCLTQLEEYTLHSREQCHCKDSSGIKKAYIDNLVFYFRALIATWLYRVEVVSNAIEHYQPKTVIGVGPEEIGIANSLCTESVERFTTDIIRQVCERKGITFNLLPMNMNSKIMMWNASKWIKGLAKNVLCSILSFFIKPRKKTIIVPSDSHNIKSVLETLKKDLGEQYELDFLELPAKRTFEEIWASIFPKNERACRYLFYNSDKKVTMNTFFLEQRSKLREEVNRLIDSWSYRDVSLAKWLKPKYKLALEPGVIDKTYYRAVNLNKFLEQWKPVFILSQHARDVTAVIGELCSLKNMPSLMIPHGSFTPVADEFSKKDWKENALGLVDTPYKFVALQTPLIEKFLVDIPVESESVKTGPLIFGRKIENGHDVEFLRKKYAPNGEKIIIHAGTPKHRVAQRFYTYETIDEYVDGISSLIEAANRIGGVHVIIRYRVIDGLTTDELKRLLPDYPSFSIASDGNFSDYLCIADLLVSYSSTTMEEALQNNTPVLLFNKYDRYQHIKGEEISPNLTDISPSAVYNVNSEEDLPYAIEWILEHHLSQKTPFDSLFDKYKYKSEEIVDLSKFIHDQECVK